MILHVKDAIITENYKVLAGSSESEGDNGNFCIWASLGVDKQCQKTVFTQWIIETS
jgi:hypothetical protein